MKYLITSTQSPGNGGAATNAYKIIKHLRKQGHKAYGIFFLCNNEDPYSVDIDPDYIEHIDYLRCYWKTGDIQEAEQYVLDVKNRIENYLDGEPDVIWAKNVLAPLSSSALYPKVKIVYLVSGVSVLTIINNMNQKDGHELISGQKFLNNDYSNEIELALKNNNSLVELKTMFLSSEVLVNSQLTKECMIKIFPQYNEKIVEPVNTSLYTTNDITDFETKKFEDREYDLIFVSSSFGRLIKNPQFCKQIFDHEKTKNLKKLVIGDGDLFDGCPNTTHIPRTDHKEVLKHMNNSKLLLMTSYFDSSPNTLYEAVNCGCKVLISKNIGAYDKFPEENVCSDVYDVDEWLGKIQSILP